MLITLKKYDINENTQQASVGLQDVLEVNISTGDICI